MSPRLIGLCVALLALVADQASKQVIIENIGIYPQFIAQVTSFFNLVLVWNSGISFGMFAAAQDWMPLALTVMALGICAMLGVWLWRASHRLTVIALGLIIGGALGNVIDRFRFGAVLDFLDFHAFGQHWPAFNIADSTIFIGVVLLLIDSILHPDTAEKKPCDSSPESE